MRVEQATAIIMAQNTQICGNCGTDNVPGARFCSKCGYGLAGGPVYPTMQSNPANSAATVVNVSTSRRVTGALLPGNILSGRYRVVAMIGKGGFGAVYKAADERFQSKRIVAVKEMSDAALSPTEKAKVLQDFRNEADLLVQLKHPNLPNVSDFFEEGGKAYLVMEFIEGKTLATVQDEQSIPLDERLVMGWALQLCAVLHYLHTRPHPIIFRDMKPTNVMITAEGEIKLIDFGIARIFKTAVKKDTSLLGSQGYAPLEQYGRGQSDARSDIYALGATLYDLLTKELPADAPSRSIHPSLFSTPRQLNPNISPAVDAIILKAMQMEPNDRYQAAAEMYQAIAATGLVSANSLPLSVNTTMANMPTNLSSSAPVSGGIMYPNTPPSLAGSSMGLAGAVPPPPPPTGGVPSGPTSYSGVPSAPTPYGNNPYGGMYTTPPPQSNRRAFLIGGLVAGAAIIGGGALVLTHPWSSGSGTPTSTASGTITLNFTCSTEKQTWMDQAISAFNSKNIIVGGKVIKVVPDYRGSGDALGRIKDGIKNGTTNPAAWSPASDLELNQLLNTYNNAVFTSGDLGARPLVLSPLVFAAWKSRSDILKAKYGSIDWSSVHDALQVLNWSSIGGQASWGPVKLGQTRPDSSNSGLLSITLLAYTYYSKTSHVLTVDKVRDPGFLTYLSDVENNVSKFGRSSGTYITNEVILNGPSEYDIVTTYENLILINQQTAISRQGEPLIPSYPSLNIVSNHPFAILNSASPDEQQAAKAFRDFLLGKDQQQQALLQGFRPVNPDVTIHDSISGNPFTANLGFQVLNQLPTQVQAPRGDVIDELINQWLAKYSGVSTALSINSEQTQRIL